MIALRKGSSIAAALLFMCCGGSDENPPLDEMTLRDALLAEPSVIGQLSVESRGRLRSRLTSERLRPEDQPTAVGLPSEMPMLKQVLAMDAVRFSAGHDALLTSNWQRTAVGGQAIAYTAAVGTRSSRPLPALGGEAAIDTDAAEQRALAGAAGALLEQMLAASGAQKLERVVAWPIAVMASGDSVYVNGAWLTAMDESTQNASSGAGGSSKGATPLTAGAAKSGLYLYLTVESNAAQASSAPEDVNGVDGGTVIDGPNHASGFDCSSSSCNSSASSCSNSASSCSSSSSDACKSTSDNCQSTSDHCSNNCQDSPACNDPTGDQHCCRACTLAAAPPPIPVVAYSALMWLLAPLGFLLFCDGGLRRGWRKKSAPRSAEQLP